MSQKISLPHEAQRKMALEQKVNTITNTTMIMCFLMIKNNYQKEKEQWGFW